MKSISILAEAVNQWPEDEAYGLYVDLIEGDEPADQDQINKSIAHIKSFFMRESDSAELIKRFDAHLNYLIKSKGGYK